MISRNKSSKKKLILPILIGLIMVLSIIGFSITFNSDNTPNTDSLGNSVTYNGREYILTQQGWAVNIDEGYVVFAHNPEELDDISLPLFNLGNKVYIAYDPDNKDQNIDFIIQKLNNILLYKNIRPVNSCIKDSQSCPNIPVVDCNSRDKSITITKQDELEIIKEDNCLHIKGTASDLDRITDKLAMQWLGLL